jgi:hypothetical protein
MIQSSNIPFHREVSSVREHSNWWASTGTADSIRAIWEGVKFETPKERTLPESRKAEKAAATSSGSISGLGRCNNSRSRYSVFRFSREVMAEWII